MATDNAQALFGGAMLPEEMQRELINQRALEFGKLSVADQLGTMGYKTGAAIGGGLAKAMGVDITDPRIKTQSKLQELSQGIPQTAEGLAEYSRRITAAGLPAIYASQAMDKAREIAKTEASSLPEKQRLAMSLADTMAKRGTPEWMKSYQESLADVINPEKSTTNQKEYKQAVNEGSFKGTFTEWVEKRDKDKSTKINMPEIKLPADVNAIISSYEKAIEGDVEVKNLAGTAKGLINQAATSNNPSAWEAARTQTAKAIGQGKLSNEDIARIGVDPTLVGGLRDWLDKKIVGVPDANTQKALYSVASYLENTAGGRIAEKRSSRIAAAKAINPAIDTGMMFPDYAGKGGNVPSPAGSGKIVDFKDLKVNK